MPPCYNARRSMARRLTDRNLRALTDSIQALYQSCELESFPEHVFAAVTPLVPCDYFSYNEFGPDGALRLVHCEPGLPAAATEFLVAIGPEFSKEHPTVSYVARTGSPEPFKITDFTAQRQWRQTRLYNEFYHPLRCEYQMAFASPLADGQVALAFNSAARDYSEEDRQMLGLLRPHLMQARANAQMFTRLTATLQTASGAFISAAADGSIEYATVEAMRCLERYCGVREPAVLPLRLQHWLLKPARGRAAQPLVIEAEEAHLQITLASRERDGTCNLVLDEQRHSGSAERLMALGLTPREAEVLIWVARGKTTAEIAMILDSKTGTVSKHLEHIYLKLGVENRTSAAAYVTRL